MSNNGMYRSLTPKQKIFLALEITEKFERMCKDSGVYPDPEILLLASYVRGGVACGDMTQPSDEWIRRIMSEMMNLVRNAGA